MNARRELIVTGAWLGLCLAGPAAALPVTYTITVKGTGPGIENASVAYHVNLVECAGCSAEFNRPAGCGVDFETNIPPQPPLIPFPPPSGCLPGGGFKGYQFRDAVPGPASVTWNFSPASNWSDMVIDGIASGGVRGVCITTPSGMWTGSATGDPITALGVFSLTYATAQLNCAHLTPACGSFNDNNGECDGPPLAFGFSVTYPRQSQNASKECSQTGTAEVPVDNLWHQVASATCMQSPDTATAWVGSASAAGGGQPKAVMTSVNPNLSASPWASGPALWIKVKPPCSNCTTSYQKPDKGQCSCTDDALGGSKFGMKLYGCFMTCLAITQNVSPCDMNKILMSKSMLDKVSGKPKDSFTTTTSLGLKFVGEFDFGSTSDGAIADALCSKQLVLVGLKKGLKTHWVIITSQSGSGGKCHFSIQDPACKSPKSSLNDYTDNGWSAHVILYCQKPACQ